MENNHSKQNPPVVFISYATADGINFARRLCNDLENDNIKVWMDKKNISPGVNWNAEIDMGLQSAHAVIVILTPGAVLSPEVESEWREALNRFLTVIPLMVMDCDVPRRLNGYQNIDFRNDYDYIAGIGLLRKRLHSLDADYLEYLERTLSDHKAAQKGALDPRRFQSKINSLQSTIDNWSQRIDLQQDRIAKGLKELRLHVENGERGSDRNLPIVIGQRLQDVEGYFKNRHKELEETGRLLAASSTRLVSIIGRSGMGKTALVSNVMRDMERNRWPHTEDNIPVDGIVYLSTHTGGITLERLFLDCAKMLGGKKNSYINALWISQELDIREKVSCLVETLTNGLYIILMDNMEDILDNDGWIIDDNLRIFFDNILTSPHDARILVTSRVPLTFQKEVMRFNHQVALTEGLPCTDGVNFLRELDPHGLYELRDEVDEKLAKAVKAVHGVPRALELIAGILANDPFAHLDNIIEGFFHHEDVVRDLVEENYRRLDNDTRRVMDALSVFKRPVPKVAIDYLLEPFFPGLNLPNILQRLVNTRIVQINRVDGTVTLHPIDQDYVYSQLSENGTNKYTRQSIERRAAQYYQALRKPDTEWKSIGDLDPQLAEFEHWIKGDDYIAAARLIDALDLSHLSLWGHCRRVLYMRMKLLGNIKDKRLEMINLNSLGLACRYLGDYAMAIEYHRKASLISHDIRDKPAECISLSGIGHTNSLMGNYEDASRYLRETITLARETGDKHNECVALDRMGVVCRNQGHMEMSIDYCNQALTIARKIGERQCEGSVLENLGIAHRNLGYADKSIDYLQKALDIAREICDKNMEGRVLTNFGYSYIHLKRFVEAIDRLQQALITTREIFDRRFEGWALDAMGSACLSLDRIDEAVKNMKQAMIIHREINNRSGERKSLVGLSKTCLRKKDFEKAVDYLKNATVIDHELGNMREEAEDLCDLGSISLQLKKYNQSLEYYRKAYTIFEMIGMKESVEKVKCHIKDIRDLPSVLFPNGSEKDI